MYNKIYDYLDDKIYDLFMEFQDEMDIESGDIEPLDNWKMMQAMADLAIIIQDIMEKQKGDE